jgi:hypothetical protein
MKFYKMGHEAPEWPRSNLGSFELGAPDPILFPTKLCKKNYGVDYPGYLLMHKYMKKAHLYWISTKIL